MSVMNNDSKTSLSPLLMAGRRVINEDTPADKFRYKVYIPIGTAFGNPVKTQDMISDYLRRNPDVWRSAESLCKEELNGGIGVDWNVPVHFTYDAYRIDNVEYPRNAGFLFSCQHAPTGFDYNPDHH